MNIPKGNWYASTSPDYFEGGATVVRTDEPHEGLVIAVLTKMAETNPEHTAILMSKSRRMYAALIRLAEATSSGDVIAATDEAVEIIKEVQVEQNGAVYPGLWESVEAADRAAQKVEEGE